METMNRSRSFLAGRVRAAVLIGAAFAAMAFAGCSDAGDEADQPTRDQSDDARTPIEDTEDAPPPEALGPDAGSQAPPPDAEATAGEAQPSAGGTATVRLGGAEAAKRSNDELLNDVVRRFIAVTGLDPANVRVVEVNQETLALSLRALADEQLKAAALDGAIGGRAILIEDPEWLGRDGGVRSATVSITRFTSTSDTAEYFLATHRLNEARRELVRQQGGTYEHSEEEVAIAPRVNAAIARGFVSINDTTARVATGRSVVDQQYLEVVVQGGGTGEGNGADGGERAAELIRALMVAWVGARSE